MTPPPSMNSTCGTIPAARTTPRSPAVPPLSSTAKDTASEDIEVPSREVAYPAKNRAKSRSRSTVSRRRDLASTFLGATYPYPLHHLPRQLIDRLPVIYCGC